MPILTPEERVGSTIAGKYRLDRILARGGMGTVFAGVHEWTHRGVAVKVLHYEHARDPEVVRRFLQEARASARLKHPHVVDVLDMGQEHDGSVYLVLELLEGETLKRRMRAGALGPAEILDLLGPIMEALATAHAIGVVHRDLKPDNIFLALEQDRVVPKILDFGIAKVSGHDSSETRTGMMIGTPQYMSPEQVRGQRDVGPPADVWSMGVVLYEMVAGRQPFAADSAAAVIAKVMTERPPPLRVVAPGLPDAVVDVIERALAADAAARPRDMAELLAEVRAAFGGWAAGADSFVMPSHELVFERTQATPAPAFSAEPIIDLPMVDTVQLDVASLASPSAQPEPAPESVTPFAWASPPEPESRRTGLLVVGLGALGVLAAAVGVGTVLFLNGPGEEPAPRSSTAPAIVAVEPDEAEVAEEAPAITETYEEPAPAPEAEEAPDLDLAAHDGAEQEATEQAEAAPTPSPEPVRPGRPAPSTAPRPARGTRGALILR